MSTIVKKNGSSKGCLLIALSIGFVLASGFYFLTAGIRDAKRNEQILIDRFDFADKYTPSINGSIDPERMEAFIRVRETMQSACAEYQEILISIGNLDKLETDKEISPGEATSTGIESFKSIFSAGPRMVVFSETRNQALLAENMGLGEYIYIYLSAYGEQLAAESGSVYAGMEEAYPGDRTRKEFAQILANQLLAIEAGEQPSSSTDTEESLRAEIEALQTGKHSSPWPNGPVGMLRESLAPYQQRLIPLYCSGIVKIELLQKNRGFQLDG